MATVAAIEQQWVTLRIDGLALKVIDTDRAGKRFFDMVAAFADFERASASECQLKRIAPATADGIYVRKGQ